jgi:hypothetical protein
MLKEVFDLYFWNVHSLLGHAVVQLIAALCYKLEGRGFNS